MEIFQLILTLLLQLIKDAHQQLLNGILMMEVIAVLSLLGLGYLIIM
jgi:hypothetical protein